MEHLNYCRQIRTAFLEDLGYAAQNISPLSAWHVQMRKLISSTIPKAEKFLLPVNAALPGNLALAAIDEQQALHLPFPCIALEFALESDEATNAAIFKGFSKACFLAEEYTAADAEGIVLAPVLFNRLAKFWFPLPTLFIPRTGYLKRDSSTTPSSVYFKVIKAPGAPEGDDEALEFFCSLVATTLLGVLNILNCANVRTEKSYPKKTQLAMRHKGALPFDAYHILTVGAPHESKERGASVCGGHSSPREHLRRGHIRRLQDGRCIWVNASLVNAGVGGVVKKSYRLR